MGACLAWGAGAVISHRAAAAVWRLAGFEPGFVELTVPRRRRRSGPGMIRRNRLLVSDVTTVGGIPVTTPARTLIDLASVVPRETVEESMDDALRRGLVSLTDLRRQLAEVGGRGRAGTATMRLLLDSRDPSTAVPGSVFERRLLRALIRAGLPPPALQHEIRSRDRLVAVVDFAFPNERLAIEADGYRWHSGRRRWDYDRARRNELTLLGWRVIHVTWTELTRRPLAVTAAIRKALESQ